MPSTTFFSNSVRRLSCSAGSLGGSSFTGAIVPAAPSAAEACITIGEGVDEGFSFWDWLVIGVCAAFILQAVSRLTRPEARA